jgi:hypothetical protein
MTRISGFTDNDWIEIQNTWHAWWEGRLNRPIITIEANEDVCGPSFLSSERHLTQYGLTTPAEIILDDIEPSLYQTHWMGDAFPRWWPNFGAGFLAGCLGSPVRFANDTTWFYPIEKLDFEKFKVELDRADPWYQRLLDITKLAVERWGNQVTIGFTDLGGNLDILASLRSSQQLLTDLYDFPEEVAALLNEITTIWLSAYDDLYEILSRTDKGVCAWGPQWMPGKGYMLQSDFSYMVSPRMFARFALPDLQACSAHLDYGFYHLDGAGEIRHLDYLLEIPHLRGIQWIPGDGAPPPEEWIDLLRRIRQGGKLCQVYVTPRGAQKIIRELGGEGFNFALWEDTDSGHRDLTPQEGEAALIMLCKEGVGL